MWENDPNMPKDKLLLRILSNTDMYVELYIYPPKEQNMPTQTPI
jgi:hypothetical protein